MRDPMRKDTVAPGWASWNASLFSPRGTWDLSLVSINLGAWQKKGYTVYSDEVIRTLVQTLLLELREARGCSIMQLLTL